MSGSSGRMLTGDQGFSPDPYLTGEMFATTIEGIQAQGVQACGKHYIGNEQVRRNLYVWCPWRYALTIDA